MSETEKLPTNPLVSVIIINFNGLDYILDCIDSVFKSNYANFEVILIDNNSTDGSSDKCKEKFPKITLIQNKKNLAMAARNKGIDVAKGDFVVFLDADTVVNSNWLDVLLDSYKKHGKGLYQGKLLKKDDPSIIESCGDMANIFSTGFARGRGQKDLNQFENFQKISFPVGACTFSSTQTFKEIGYVDESSLFFLMLDDLDYGWRGWLLNIPSYYEPKCVIYHVGSPILQWNSKKFFFMERNRLICLFSLYSKKTLFKIFPLLILYDMGVSLFLISKGMTFTKFKSTISFLGMLPSVLKRRKFIQSKRKLKDSDIIKNFVDGIDIPVDMNTDSSIFVSIVKKLNKMARKLV
ncbi:glycoprotein 3-alpha-L-fucosyltransferase [Marine Group I thaumarchaeote SCGC AAA799-P11]|uniref:Glycoprotein 3-alpha-L-fucosyltransferase n=1 Tax=Marine Group I thaumarchaeote SCGC AAA799-P11 TaxID=1502295 RepID=A0A087S2Y1_9ARCH|nr:glycoprotein 3-alpha-L-fucosyltransferase [Marine Group I thaumarchaeote SCGC AAA799-P11]